MVRHGEGGAPGRGCIQKVGMQKRPAELLTAREGGRKGRKGGRKGGRGEGGGEGGRKEGGSPNPDAHWSHLATACLQNDLHIVQSAVCDWMDTAVGHRERQLSLGERGGGREGGRERRKGNELTSSHHHHHPPPPPPPPPSPHTH